MSGHVYLVGFMGAGKSTVGEMVAGRLGMPFIDLDTSIEDRAGMSIADIFARDGEESFRALETQELARASAGDDVVIACGGGIVGDPRNIDLMRMSGTVVYLKVGLADVFARADADGSRPLLAGGPEAVQALLESREPLYEAAADLVVGTGSRSPEEVAEAIAKQVVAS